jgi:O-antigen ligase
MHLLAGCLWLMLLGVSRGAEGVAFGLLLAVAVIRLPVTWRVYARLLDATPFLLFLCFAEWQSLSVMWSKAKGLGLNDVLPRYVLACLAIWPLMGRWRTLMLALAVGAAGYAGFVIVLSALQATPTQQALMARVFTDIPTAGITMAVALAAMTGRPWPRGIWARGTVVLGAGVVLCGIGTLGQRMPMIAGIGGAMTGLLAPADGNRTLRSLAWRAALALAAVATLGSLALTLGSARNRAWVSTLYSAVTDAGQPLKQDEAAQLTSERAPLARMALAIWSDSPLFGAGAHGFAVENKRRTAADPDFYGCSPERTALIAKLTSAHNAFLDEAAERGVVGISLLAALVATCAWWAWKADPSTATLGMLAAWFGLSLTTPASLRTVPMMLLALIVARTSMLAGCRRPLG